MSNLERLEIAKEIINEVIKDIEKINNLEKEDEIDYFIDFDLANGNYIKYEDFESLVSIIDTINDIVEYNKQ